jgi:hypothetical protein
MRLSDSALSIERLVAEYFHLDEALSRLGKTCGEDESWEELSAPIRDRMADIARKLILAAAGSGAQLGLKAKVALDWLEPGPSDIIQLLCTSLCRDIVLMFPPES